MTDHDGVEQVITMAWRAQLFEFHGSTTASASSSATHGSYGVDVLSLISEELFIGQTFRQRA